MCGAAPIYLKFKNDSVHSTMVHYAFATWQYLIEKNFQPHKASGNDHDITARALLS